MRKMSENEYPINCQVSGETSSTEQLPRHGGEDSNTRVSVLEFGNIYYIKSGRNIYFMNFITHPVRGRAGLA